MKKESLIRERIEIVQKLTTLDGDIELSTSRLRKFLELSKSAYLSFKSANDEEKRDLVETITSNIVARDKKLIIKLKSPFDRVLERPRGPSGGPFRDTSRTLSALLSRLLEYFKDNAKNDRDRICN